MSHIDYTMSRMRLFWSENKKDKKQYFMTLDGGETLEDWKEYFIKKKEELNSQIELIPREEYENEMKHINMSLEIIEEIMKK